MASTIFFTSAYNAENTLRRTIESVLTQTNGDFVYYLADNGSQDKTRKIIYEYANKDDRILPVFHDKNNLKILWEFLPTLCNERPEKYFSIVDADDTLKPNYLKNMLNYIELESLDVAVCGNDFIDAKNNQLVEQRILETNLILKDPESWELLSIYHKFMRTTWCKVFKISLLRQCHFDEAMKNVYYGGDTLFTTEAFKNSNRVGILSESLHKYYISLKSSSYCFEGNRIASDQILFEATRDFLLLKCGQVSSDNQTFLFGVYYYAIRDTVSVLLSSKESVLAKLEGLREIFRCELTQSMIKKHYNNLKDTDLFVNIPSWVMSQNEIFNFQGMEIAAEILAAMGYYPMLFNKWSMGWKYMLLVNIKRHWVTLGMPDNLSKQIILVTSQVPLIQSMQVDFLVYFKTICFSVINHDYQSALQEIDEIISNETDIPDAYSVDLVTLGLNLAAKLDQGEKFIYFKKLQVSLLINFHKVNEAKKQLENWDEILPDDHDFKILRARLS